MKKKLLLSLILICIAIFSFGMLNASAYTSGYYTYTVSNGEATITDVNTSISGDITIPSTLGGYHVTSIGDSAFWDCTSLTSVTIPGSVTSIGIGAFNKCTSLTTITIPDSVTSIGDGAFKYCPNLTSVTIPDNVTSIGNGVFIECTSLTTITIPYGVTSIGDHAFGDCRSLTSITIPDSVTTIAGSAFSYCISLTTINIPDSVTTIGNYAFYRCQSLTSITIPDSVTSIGEYTFYHCTNLTSLSLPDSVTSIGGYAFYYCTNLTDVYYEGSKEEWNNIRIGTNNSYPTKATIHYNSNVSCLNDLTVDVKGNELHVKAQAINIPEEAEIYFSSYSDDGRLLQIVKTDALSTEMSKTDVSKVKVYIWDEDMNAFTEDAESKIS